jgi:hypothetical protein
MMNKRMQVHNVPMIAVVFVLPVIMLFTFSPSAAATGLPHPLYQDSEPTPVPTAAPDVVLNLSKAGQADFTFRELGISTHTLRYPADSLQFTVRVPYRWTIIPGVGYSYIDLKYDMLYQGPDTSSPESEEIEPALLNVYVEDELAASFNQAPGSDQQVRIPIPAAAVTDHSSNQYSIRIAYFNTGDCNRDDWNANLILNEESVVHLSFRLRPAVLRIFDFPRPLLNDSFLPERVLIVIPDHYSDADLTAAARVSWILGARARRDVTIDTLTVSEVADHGLENTSAILIGKPGDNALLASLLDSGIFPTKRAPDEDNGLLGPDGAAIARTDGVLQLATSSVDANVFYLAVTGGTDHAVLMAAQALSDDTPLYPQDSNLAIIGEIRDTGLVENGLQDTYTLMDLGLTDIVIYGLTSIKETATLFIPRDWVITEDPTLELNYMHSSQLSPANSGLIVELNGDIVGDAPIVIPATGIQRTVIQLSKELFIPGQDNRLSFELINGITGECIPFDTLTAWMRLLKTSSLHISHEIATDVVATFPDPISHLYQGSSRIPLVLVLPSELSPELLNGMSAVAQSLGNKHSDGAGLMVVFDSNFDPETYADYHIMVIGQPDKNKVLADLNDSLPQSFEPGSNALKQQLGRTSYQIPADFSLGVIEVTPSPWNEQRAVTVITGTTPEGLKWALNTVISPGLSGSLKYDLNFIRDKNVQSLDSKAFTPGTLEVAVGETINEQATEIPTVTPAAEVTAEATEELAAVPTVVVPTPTTTLVPPRPAEDYEPQSNELDDTLQSVMVIIGGLGVILVGSGFIWNARKIFRSFHE